MTEALAIRYVAARPRLLRIAYAVLCGQAEAEDVLSDYWLRLVGAQSVSQSGTSTRGRLSWSLDGRWTCCARRAAVARPM
jgi:DNA-directed RNA polymerase specialized sigma24 family protein